MILVRESTCNSCLLLSTKSGRLVPNHFAGGNFRVNTCRMYQIKTIEENQISDNVVCTQMNEQVILVDNTLVTITYQ